MKEETLFTTDHNITSTTLKNSLAFLKTLSMYYHSNQPFLLGIYPREMKAKRPVSNGTSIFIHKSQKVE